MIQDQRTIESLRELGVQVPDDFNAIQRAGSFELAQQKLAELKERVRKNYRKLAFELHPDRTGGDPARTEHFVFLTRVRDDLERLKLRRPVQPMPPPPPVVVAWHNPMRAPRPTYVPTGSNGSVYTTYYTTQSPSATSTTVGFDPFHVVIMRPF